MLRTLVTLLSLAAMPGLSAADGHTDFSGRWQMDRARSESIHQGVPMGAVTLLIRQSPAEVTITTTTGAVAKAPASSETLTYKLDRSDNAVTVGGTTVTTRARWVGSKLRIETARTVNETSITTEDVLGLGAGGKELTVEKALTVQHGYQSPSGNNTGRAKDVFVRTTAPDRK